MSLKESWESKGTVFNPALETEFPIPPPQALQEASIDWQPNPVRISLFEHHRFISLEEPKVGIGRSSVIFRDVYAEISGAHTFFIFLFFF